ncbi:MAG: hypothetical protein ACJ8FS_05180 [Sphingomicrobium sp.]
MSRRRNPVELRQPNDTAAMRLAIDWCVGKGYPVRRCSPCQLRVGPINFWPNSGTINFEASRAARPQGLVAFRRIVVGWYSLSELEREAALETLGELGADALSEQLLKTYLL